MIRAVSFIPIICSLNKEGFDYMGFETPRLDDRSFNDIVEEARARIPLYTPEWTDHNVSDPGITMIELFAWMTDIVLYRLNRVPDKHYVKFMELIGMHLEEAEPARVQVTFWLSAPQPNAIMLPNGTEVRNRTSHYFLNRWRDGNQSAEAVSCHDQLRCGRRPFVYHP